MVSTPVSTMALGLAAKTEDSPLLKEFREGRIDHADTSGGCWRKSQQPSKPSAPRLGPRSRRARAALTGQENVMMQMMMMWQMLSRMN